MISAAHLIWICPICIIAGILLCVLIINEGGYPDD